MDESGLLMAPLVRRSWAPRGHPPRQEEKGGHREKVSVTAAIWLTPSRDRLGLAYQTLVNAYFTNVEVAEFAQAAVSGLAGPVIMPWDGGTMHKGGPIREVVERSRGRLDIESMPAHAPELMPVEFLWRWLKYDRLCNFAPPGARALNEAIVRELEPTRQDQELLRSFFHQFGPPIAPDFTFLRSYSRSRIRRGNFPRLDGLLHLVLHPGRSDHRTKAGREDSAS